MGIPPSDKRYDPTQRFNPPKKFQQVGSHVFEKLRQMILNHVVAGNGISVKRVGEKTIVSATGAGRGLGSTGGGSSVWRTAASKAALPNDDIVDTMLGRVIGGDDKGVIYIRNPDNDGWDAINRLE